VVLGVGLAVLRLTGQQSDTWFDRPFRTTQDGGVGGTLSQFLRATGQRLSDLLRRGGISLEEDRELLTVLRQPPGGQMVSADASQTSRTRRNWGGRPPASATARDLAECHCRGFEESLAEVTLCRSLRPTETRQRERERV
jgi:hypothetical protein